MLRLAWHFSVRSGREAITRLLVTASAAGLGVVILLCVLADFHAFEVTSNRACCSARRAPR